MDVLMIWLQFAVFIACIIIGARLGGVGLGMMGGIGLFILVFVFGLRPAAPPVDVMLIIIAVITAASTLQASGGLDYLAHLAERILRKYPQRITILGPIVTYFFTLFAGTGFVAFAVFPVISEVAYEAGIRPERPMSISVIASQLSITASPMSAATAAMVAMLAPYGITLGHIMLVCVPATLIATFVGALSVYKRGKELTDDSDFQERVAAGEIKAPEKVEKKEITPEAKRSVVIFAIMVLAVLTLGTFRSLLPSWDVDGRTITLSIPHVIQMVMLAGSAFIIIFCKVRTGVVIRGNVFQAGLMGVIAIFGVAWMGNTFFGAHNPLFVASLSGVLETAPWLFAIALFILSALLFSQGATVGTLMPFGLVLGLPAPLLVGMFPAVNGYFFIPASGPTLGAIAFDRTGTTKIGKYLLNHSFMRPGMISIFVSVGIGLLLARILL